MKTLLAKISICILALPVLLYGIRQISKSRSFQFFGGIVNNIQTDKNIIALTFDDGPTSGNTQKVLDILDKNDIKVTFFVIGQEIENNPGELQKIIAKGHEVGNHSYSHKRMILKSPSRVKDEIEKTDILIQAAGYTGNTYFRTPYGKKLIITPYILRNLNKANIFFDVEPESFATIAGSGTLLHDYVVEKTKAGSIILLHPMYGESNKTIEVLDQLIISLKEKGFEFVTVDELMQQTDTGAEFW